jgi:chromosome segregation ATPase
MQAITTLHAQLCLATERLDSAQNCLNAQEIEVRNLREESRSKLEEIDDLRRMLNEMKERERLAIEKLDDLQLQTVPLELECQRNNCELEILPRAFQKLADEFMTESRKTMNQVDNLLYRAKKENFWKGKLLMNAHHIDASKIRLKQQRKLFSEALLSEEIELNKQLAEEESSLSMVQACIDAIERKNAEISQQQDLQYSMQRPQLSEPSMESLRPTSQVSHREISEMPHENYSGGVYNKVNSGTANTKTYLLVNNVLTCKRHRFKTTDYSVSICTRQTIPVSVN